MGGCAAELRSACKDPAGVFAEIALRFRTAASHLYIKLKRHSKVTEILLCLKFYRETYQLLFCF